MILGGLRDIHLGCQLELPPHQELPIDGFQKEVRFHLLSDLIPKSARNLGSKHAKSSRYWRHFSRAKSDL